MGADLGLVRRDLALWGQPPETVKISLCPPPPTQSSGLWICTEAHISTHKPPLLSTDIPPSQPRPQPRTLTLIFLRHPGLPVCLELPPQNVHFLFSPRAGGTKEQLSFCTQPTSERRGEMG